MHLRQLGRVRGSAFYGNTFEARDSTTRAHRLMTDTVSALRTGEADRYFRERSQCWAARTSLSPEAEDGRLRFVARTAGRTSFRVRAEDLAAANQFEFVGNASTTMIVNVSGRTATIYGKHLILSGLNAGQILFNFYEAETLELGASGTGDFGMVGVPATILAPHAHVRFENGLLTGQLISGALSGGLERVPGGQVNESYFRGWTDECGCDEPRSVPPGGTMTHIIVPWPFETSG